MNKICTKKLHEEHELPNPCRCPHCQQEKDGQAALDYYANHFPKGKKNLTGQFERRKGKAMMTKVLDALPLEYKQDYGTAYRTLNVADIMNNLNVFGPSISEKIQERRGLNEYY